MLFNETTYKKTHLFRMITWPYNSISASKSMANTNIRPLNVPISLKKFISTVLNISKIKLCVTYFDLEPPPFYMAQRNILPYHLPP